MSEDVGYGDCRDTCIEYAIASECACMDCAEEIDEETRQMEEEEKLK